MVRDGIATWQNVTVTLDDQLAVEVGTGKVLRPQANAARLSMVSKNTARYHNAQLDDYHVDGVMRWRPPLTMTVRARFSHPQSVLRGTAGFGFWNNLLGMTKIERGSSWFSRFRLPQAVWFFFASPPSDMPYAMGVPGYGWKAATIDASRLIAKALMPFAPFGMLLCRWDWAYQQLWPVAQHVLKVDEKLLSVEMTEWHEYHLEWGRERCTFAVDDEIVFRTRYAPRGPLGFVTWIDNQYMVATPQGRFRHAALETDEQSVELADLAIVRTS